MAKPSDASCTKPGAHIIDIRSNSALTPLGDQIRSGLKPADGEEKRLPTVMLYNEEGLKLFEKITYLEEYYLTGQEIEVLKSNADRIADRLALQPGSIVVELGSGNLRKVKILLDVLDRKCTDISYYALDLSEKELKRTLAQVLDADFRNVKCFGLLGTYDDGLAWLKEPKNVSKAKTILYLGSSIGNFSRPEAAEFLSQFGDILGRNDSMLIAVDACTEQEKVFHAYNDREGVTHEFILNGLHHANELLGYEAFHVSDWKVVGEYDKLAVRHQAFVVPSKDVKVEDVVIKAGEKVRIEESHKYSPAQSTRLWSEASLHENARWQNARGDYALHLVKSSKINSPPDPDVHAVRRVEDLDRFGLLGRDNQEKLLESRGVPNVALIE